MAEPLYNQNGIRIEVSHSSAPDFVLSLGHVLGQEVSYPFKYGKFYEIALANELRAREMLSRSCPDIESIIDKNGISLNELRSSFLTARSENIRRFNEYLNQAVWSKTS